MGEDTPLSDMSIDALRMRQTLGQMILRLLRTDWAEEEGAEQAFQTYREQLRRVNQALWEKIKQRREANGYQKPSPRIIHAQVGTMGAKKGN